MKKYVINKVNHCDLADCRVLQLRTQKCSEELEMKKCCETAALPHFFAAKVSSCKMENRESCTQQTSFNNTPARMFEHTFEKRIVEGEGCLKFRLRQPRNHPSVCFFLPPAGRQWNENQNHPSPVQLLHARTPPLPYNTLPPPPTLRPLL